MALTDVLRARGAPVWVALLCVRAPDYGLLGHYRLGIRPRARKRAHRQPAARLHYPLRTSSLAGWTPRGSTGCWPPHTVRRRSPWRSSSGRTSRVSITWERIVPGCNTRHRAVDCAADERQVVIPQLCCLVFCCSKWRIVSQARNRFAKVMAARNLCTLDTTLAPPGAQHGATR